MSNYQLHVHGFCTAIISLSPGPLTQCQKYLVGKAKYWMQKVVQSDKCMGVSQLLGGTCRPAPQSLRLCPGLLIVRIKIPSPGLRPLHSGPHWSGSRYSFDVK